MKDQQKTKPDFIDNRNENTLEQALGEVLEGSSSGCPNDEVRIATAFFSPTGFAKISDFLKKVPTVRLLLSVDLAAGAATGDRRLEENEKMFEQRRMKAGLTHMSETMMRERDRLPFTRSSNAALKKLVDILRAGNMEVRRYEQAFLHAKTYIFSATDGLLEKNAGIIVGSSNLTSAGLTSNLELNLGRYDHSTVQKGLDWFDDLWDEAVPYDLATIFEKAMHVYTPWDIFIRVLWQLYGDEVEEDARNDGGLPLTNFQKHGVNRALRLIESSGGAIVADEVGLGKTFIAGEILSIYHKRRQRTLLICPAALRDSTWQKFLSRFELFAECRSFEDLAADEQLRDAQRPNANQKKLDQTIEEYQLVIIDEAHNYRNPDAPTRAAALRSLLFGQPKDLLLLTATPVNNSLWDLYNLLRFFVRQDAHFAQRGILSIKRLFDRAASEDPSSLSPDVLYPIIDATTVKRTRQFVKNHYTGDQIKGSDGRLVSIVFPQPKAISVRYSLEEVLPGFFDRLEAALDPESDDAIKFARYMPDAYLLTEIDSEENGRSRAMVGLLRSGLLKRFESSSFAFGKTVQKMIQEHNIFLEALSDGYVVTTKFMQEISGDDDDEVFKDMLAGTDNKDDAEHYDLEELSKAVEHDRDLFTGVA